ncbi:MAG: leucyl/phenylalanyl-tRNA--protein transferase [Verrucomicrobia bacterium]|nr:leucyl/phenylalanyl-tRNA--protein transferase [Verrucomicrobiota bacterium]
MPARPANDPWFPPAESADANGLVAVGGDLSVERLLLAYRSGLFPWTVKPVSWWSPDPRGILALDEFHVSRSLARTLRRAPFEISFDRDFTGVMRGCATQPRGERTWVTAEFIAAYTRLHAAGHAHSVECRHGGELVGGVYGVSVGGFFAGESMFHSVSDASKVALFHLVQRLRERGFMLLDVQMVTPATRALGAREIPRAEYLRRLEKAVALRCEF